MRFKEPRGAVWGLANPVMCILMFVGRQPEHEVQVAVKQYVKLTNRRGHREDKLGEGRV